MTHAPYSLRAATPDDLPVVHALLVAAGLPVDGVDEQFGDAYALAVGGGAVIGVAGMEVHGDAGLLRSAAVDRAWRGRGVGEALTNDRLQWARAQGLREVWLLTNTAADFFPRFGFARVDRQGAPDAVRASGQFAMTTCASAAAMRLTLA